MNPAQIVTIKRFLTPAGCAELLETIESVGFQSQYSGMGEPIRRRAVFEAPNWADLIWNRLKSSAPLLTEIYSPDFGPEPPARQALESYSATKLNERFRCYNYRVSEAFQKHSDFAHEYSDTARTFLTVLIYLNEGFEGGGTVFDKYTVKPQLGMLTMFPHELPHQGCKILSGRKYSLRTDVVYSSN